MLPVTAEEALDAETGGHHRRYMVHGTSHHLGIDVHDCAQARREMYYDGTLEPGMVFTIEPGLYFQIDDLTVPEKYRGIGVRIEDDILMTADGPVNLSAGIPRTADEVEAWIARPARSLTRLLTCRTDLPPPPAFTTRPTLTGTFGMCGIHPLARHRERAGRARARRERVRRRGRRRLRAARRRAAPERPGRRPGRHLRHRRGPGHARRADGTGSGSRRVRRSPTTAPEGLDLVPGAGGLAAAVPGAVDAWLAAAPRPRHLGARPTC